MATGGVISSAALAYRASQDRGADIYVRLEVTSPVVGVYLLFFAGLKK